MPYQGGGGGHYGGGGGGGGFQGGGGGGGRFGGSGGGGGGPGRGRKYENPADPNSEQFRKLFVGGLSYETDEKGLKEHFEEWGEIVDCVVMRDPMSKRSRGFGFITYKEAAQVDEAQKHRVHNIDGRDVETKRAMPRDSGTAGNQQSVNKMFVGGLKDDTTEEMVREVFAEFGEIETVDIVSDKNTGKVRGFCFVTFNDYDPVDKAVLKKRHELNGRQVEVKKAQAREAMDSNRSGGSSRGRGGEGYGGRSYNGGGGGGFGGGGGGGYGSGGYGSSGGGGGGGYGGGGYNWNSGGGGGGSYGGYNQWGSGGDGSSFGSNYGSDFSGGAMKSGNYSNRGPGPYGGGYGQGGGGGGQYGGGSFRR